MTAMIIAKKKKVKALETLEMATAVWNNIPHNICISFQAGADFEEGDPIERGIGAAIAIGLGIHNQPNVMRFYPKTEFQRIRIEAILGQDEWEISNAEERWTIAQTEEKS
jgi:hypothetical protein